MITHRRNRFRPRFSIRTLAILITLVCCYAACWGPTKRHGAEDVVHWIYRDYRFTIVNDDLQFPQYLADFYRASSPAPLVVVSDGPMVRYGEPPRRRYYFWFFGYVAKLPYEREVE